MWEVDRHGEEGRMSALWTPLTCFCCSALCAASGSRFGLADVLRPSGCSTPTLGGQWQGNEEKCVVIRPVARKTSTAALCRNLYSERVSTTRRWWCETYYVHWSDGCWVWTQSNGVWSGMEKDSIRLVRFCHSDVDCFFLQQSQSSFQNVGGGSPLVLHNNSVLRRPTSSRMNIVENRNRQGDESYKFQFRHLCST